MWRGGRSKRADSRYWCDIHGNSRGYFEGFRYWSPEETVKDGMENVRKFVKRIKELIK